MSLIKICNQYLNDISWISAEGCDYSVGNKADIWRVAVSANLPLADAFLSIMHPNEISAANKFYQSSDRNRFIVTRGTLRTILGKYLDMQPALVEFETDANKKPFVKNAGNSALQFNVSHSGDWIMFGFSGSEIGVDTELVNKYFEYNEILEENFEPREISYIKQKQSHQRFFRIWTRKEAILKATGKGITDNIKLIPGLDGVHILPGDDIASTCNWLINTFKLNENYVASVATGPGIDEIKFWDFNF